jgi:predicted phage terminase large subunit-like protein
MIKEIALRDEAIRRKAKDDFLTYTQYTFEGQYDVNQHHRLIANRLQRWADPESELDRLMIFMPPQHGKSTLASIHLPGWIFAHNSDANLIAGSYGEKLAKKNSRAAKRVLKSPFYRRLFPNVSIPDKHVSADERHATKNTAKNWEIVESSGGYLARGMDQGVSGYPADYLIIDDPLKRSHARSQRWRDTCYEWYFDSLKSRLNGRGKVLLIMTRWHQDDLAGRLLDKSKEIKEADDWDTLKLPALCEDPTAPDEWREEGEALWPSQDSREDLIGKKKESPRSFASLYQQRPRPPGGEIVETSWIEDHQYTDIPRLDRARVIQSWDLRAGGQSDDSSYAVGQLWASPKDETHIYLVDQVRERWDFPTTKDEVTRRATEDPLWSMASQIVIERKADGRPLVDTLDGKISGIVPVTPTGSKEARLEAVSWHLKNGDVRTPDPHEVVYHGPDPDWDAPDTGWVVDFIDEVTSVPSATHDDQADAMVQAINHLLTHSDDRPSRDADPDEDVTPDVSAPASSRFSF